MKFKKRPNLRKYHPDKIKGLRWEQERLKEIAGYLRKKEVPMNNRADGERRFILQELFEILSFPDRPEISGDLLYVTQLVLAYNDRAAAIFLKIVYDEWIETRITKIKERRDA